MVNFVVYGSPLSPFVRKVEAVLRFKGAAYDFENVNIMDMPDWFVEISPARRIPVLRDRDVGAEGVPGTIADSSAICLYLDRKLDTGLYGKTAFEAGRVAWFEEYADTELAINIGMHMFRPLVFPLFTGREPDVDTARKAFNEALPPRFDYLESALQESPYFMGDRFSLADIAVGAMMSQLGLVAELPSKERWPALIKHCEMIKAHPTFTDNLATCEKVLSRFLPEKFDLS